MRLRFIGIVAVATVLVSGSTSIAARTVSTFKVTMLGKNEVKGGEHDGRGVAVIKLDAASGKVCWQILVQDPHQTPTSAHIHKAPRRKVGPIVIRLGRKWKAKGCTAASRAQVARIIQTPSDYYINVDAPFEPKGAIRAQL